MGCRHLHSCMRLVSMTLDRRRPLMTQCKTLSPGLQLPQLQSQPPRQNASACIVVPLVPVSTSPALPNAGQTLATQLAGQNTTGAQLQLFPPGQTRSRAWSSPAHLQDKLVGAGPAMYSDFKGKAIEFVKVAVQEDEAGNYEKALQNYKAALEYFSTHLKYEKNPRSREAIMGKFKEYLERAEYLKGVIAEPSAVAPANGAAATVQRPKKGAGGGGGGDGDESSKEKDRLKGQLGSAIMSEKPNVKWDDVAGLEGAKEALKEAVILPVKFPQFFTGKRKPWSGILMYGPPGTGKSYLAKAVATEADSTFFSISSSDLVSKWLGESEKLVAQLFSLARENAPAIIFIDEVDSLCGSRGDGESEAARRIKTQLMIEMQGVNSNADSRVLILAATNLPYALDQAIRRRFDKRIYIPLPDAHARVHMFKVHLGDTPNSLTEADFQELGARTEGFSGSDVSIVVKDVLMQPIRLLREATHFRQTAGPQGAPVWEPCAPSAPGAKPVTLQYFMDQGLADKVQPPTITKRDFDKVLLRARPTVSPGDLDVFEKFTSEFGEEAS